jgi:cell division protein FtsI (penicillin-binding protein 3)
MAFGYNLTVTPLQTAMFYNAVANNGRMMKPYLVNAITKEGEVITEFQPQAIEEKICSDATLKQVRQCLEGVVLRGTGTNLKSDLYNIAGKTGTSLIADKGITYNDAMYQSSFAGYFPAEKPEYTIVVVIRNKMHAKKIYGGVVAGPVFKEVADALYAGKLQQSGPLVKRSADSAKYAFGGLTKSLDRVATGLSIRYYDSTSGQKVAALEKDINQQEVMKARQSAKGSMPDLTGLGLKDALEYCENQGWKLVVKGSGRVVSQSVPPGNMVAKGQTIRVELIK